MSVNPVGSPEFSGGAANSAAQAVLQDLQNYQKNPNWLSQSGNANQMMNDLLTLSQQATPAAHGDLNAAMVASWLNNANFAFQGSPPEILSKVTNSSELQQMLTMNLDPNHDSAALNSFISAVQEYANGSSPLPGTSTQVADSELQAVMNDPSILQNGPYASMVQHDLQSFYQDIKAAASTGDAKATNILQSMNIQENAGEGGMSLITALQGPTQGLEYYFTGLEKDPSNPLIAQINDYAR